jgi:alcohol dehydrogenase class IV
MGIYTLLNARRIVAGPGSIESIASVVTDLGGKKALIVTDRGVAGAGLIVRPQSLLAAAGIEVAVIDTVPPEPDVDQVNAVLAAARPLTPQVVIGIGGGSAMDAAKVVAVLLGNDLPLRDLLKQTPIVRRGASAVMIPTTAGTGSETTPNSIVLVPEDKLKVGIVSPKLLPDCVILDPELTIGLPPAITASTGMDALCHAIECYTSKKGNPFSEMLALRAIGLISGAIRRAFANGADIEARHDQGIRYRSSPCFTAACC